MQIQAKQLVISNGRKLDRFMAEGIVYLGSKYPELIFVVDSPPQGANWHGELPLSKDSMQGLLAVASTYGYADWDKIGVISCSPHIPENDWKTATRRRDFLDKYKAAFDFIIKGISSEKGKPQKPRLKHFICCSAEACYQLTGRKVAVTKGYGVLDTYSKPGYTVQHTPPVYKMLRDSSPEYLNACFNTLHAYNNKLKYEHSYEWREDDISDVITHIENKIEKEGHALVAFDTETTGFTWQNKATKVITMQLAYEEGKAVATTFHKRYKRIGDRAKIIEQWRYILTHPKVRVVAHNAKFDWHFARKLGIDFDIWADTLLLAWGVDENVTDNSLASLVKRHVPAMAGYSDFFDAAIDKSRMMVVPYEYMLEYGCGDADATYRLANYLVDRLKTTEPRIWNVIQRIKMPATRVFARMEEKGVQIDVERLQQVRIEFAEELLVLYDQLIEQVPVSILKKPVHKDKWEFTRSDFIEDILFSKDSDYHPSKKGEYVVHPDPKCKTNTGKISTDINHLLKFDHIPFVKKLIEYKHLYKMVSTYVGSPGNEKEEAKGFYKYLTDENTVHTKYLLLTGTGRSSSSDPNMQNLSKHSKHAKKFLTIFKARPGYTLLSADLSQAELRLSACSANEPVMIDLYKKGVDLHNYTAARILNLSLEDYYALPESTSKQYRKTGKLLNFSLLYGMWHTGLPSIAKKSFNMDMSTEEAKEFRRLFFKVIYPGLEKWHEKTKQFMRTSVNKSSDGLPFIESMHGIKRRLPAIFSKDSYEASEAERKGINAQIQSVASDLALMALAIFNAIINPDVAHPLLFIHDANVIEVKNEHVREVGAVLKWCMENLPLELLGMSLEVPLVADVEAGDTMGTLEELKGLEALDPKDSKLCAGVPEPLIT